MRGGDLECIGRVPAKSQFFLDGTVPVSSESSFPPRQLSSDGVEVLRGKLGVFVDDSEA